MSLLNNDRKVLFATLAALGAEIIFGFSFMFTKIALRFASPMTVIADRYIVAFLGMTVVMLLTKTKIKFKKGMWKLVLMAVFQPLLYFIFESYGIEMTTSAFSSVMISLIPIVSMICGIFVLKEIPTLAQYLFALLSVGGVILMTVNQTADGVVTPLGIVLLAGAVVSSVGYNIASRKISSEFSVFERTYAMMAIGLVSFAAIAIIENINNLSAIILPFKEPMFITSMLYLGIMSSVVAFLLLNYANTHLPVAKTTVFASITTVVSVAAGVFFLKEPFSPEAAVSVLMIIIGVVGVQKSGSGF